MHTQSFMIEKVNLDICCCFFNRFKKAFESEPSLQSGINYAVLLLAAGHQFESSFELRKVGNCSLIFYMKIKKLDPTWYKESKSLIDRPFACYLIWLSEKILLYLLAQCFLLLCRILILGCNLVFSLFYLFLKTPWLIFIVPAQTNIENMGSAFSLNSQIRYCLEHWKHFLF